MQRNTAPVAQAQGGLSMKLPTVVSALAMWTSFGFWRDLPNSARRNEPFGQELKMPGIV
jgi:hypothetical protein